jgi:single-strand DNA-binding protein
MPSFNRVTLMGNLTRDPQIKHLPSSTTVADFGLAMNRHFKTGNGEDREEVCFIECSAFGRQAEVIGQYCKKGKPLFIEGRLKYDQWDDKASGAKRSKVSVVVENFQFVGGPGDGEQRGAPMADRQATFADAREAEAPGQPAPARPASRRANKSVADGDKQHVSEADIPF